MSKYLVTMCYGKVCGSAPRKAVLISMADRANDDGSGVYVSKTRIAAETELSRATVITVTKELESEGILVAVGKRAGNHGYTVVYKMSIAKISALPDAWPKCLNLDTYDEALGNEPEPSNPEVFQVSNHSTLEKVQVSKPARLSVNAFDKNRPYRTLDNKPSDLKKASPPKRTSSFVRWEAQRERDPIKASALYAEADELAAREVSGLFGK
jgi:biotin operon repressor